MIAQVTGEEVTSDALGGADSHMALSGVTHFVADDDEQAIMIAKKLLSFLPQNNSEDPPVVDPDYVVEPDPSLASVIPESDKKGYDVREVILRLVDHQDFLEVQAGYAANIVVGFARITGRTVGIVANQPMVLSGVLDINASDKGSSFVRFCNAFNIPLLTLVDVPGFLPGVAQEHNGIIRHGAKLLYAYSAATVPKITVVLRKAYGGAYVAMCSKDLGADKVLAWPTAEIAVMGAEGAAEIVFRREISEAEDPGAPRGAGRGVPRDLLHAVRRGGARARGRHHRAGAHPRARVESPRDADHQAHHPSGQEARAGSDVTAVTSDEQTIAELREAVRALTERVTHLEASLQEQEAAGVPEEVVIAISAAVAAFLGHRAKIKQMHYRTGAAYAQQGRAVVQGRHDTQLPR